MKPIESAIWNAARQNSFGVEIETSGLSAREVIQIVASVLPCGELHPDSRCAVCVDEQGRYWKAVGDSSIIGRHTAELVTPVLRGEADLALLCDVVAALKAAGVVHCNADLCCGVHVHVGADEHTPASLVRLVKTVAARQRLLCAAVGMDAGRSEYCQPFAVDDVAQFVTESKLAMREGDMSGLQKAWYSVWSNRDWRVAPDHHYDKSRYHLLNLHSVFSKGTVEFRLYQWADEADELNPVDIKAWVMLSLVLNQVAISKSRASSHEPAADADNPAFAMRTWLVNGLGLNGAQFADVRKALGRRLGGNSAWRHCGKSYDCGQSPVSVRETMPYAYPA